YPCVNGCWLEITGCRWAGDDLQQSMGKMQVHPGQVASPHGNTETHRSNNQACTQSHLGAIWRHNLT
ncbi:hypothetical protein ILYODFUR_005226, partial [Ilyodon furcidens]